MTVMQDDYGPPQAGDVVHVAGAPYMVREVDEEWLLVAAGRTDQGTWVHRDRCRVTFRAQWNQVKDDA